jgi:hypothetical protein
MLKSLATHFMAVILVGSCTFLFGCNERIYPGKKWSESARNHTQGNTFGRAFTRGSFSNLVISKRVSSRYNTPIPAELQSDLEHQFG